LPTLIKFRGIQGKTSFIFFLVFVIIIVPVSVAIYFRVSAIVRQSDSRVHRAEAEKLIGQVRIDPDVIPLPPAGYLMFVQVGQLMERDSLFASPGFPVEIAWLNKDELEWDTLKIVTVHQAVPYSPQQIWFSLAHSSRHLQEELATLRTYLIAANAISIFLASAIVFFVSGYTLRPIHQIINVANRINASKSIERVPVPTTHDENRELAGTINNMLARIEEGIRNQTNFFASAAHELRTPLAVMKAELDTDGKSASADLKLEVERLERVIDDFLLFSELRSDTLILRVRKGELDEVLYDSIRTCRHLAKQRQCQVQVKLDEARKLTASVDHDKISAVFTNLIENAIKYSPAGSTIVVEIIKLSEVIQVSIANPTVAFVAEPDALRLEFRKASELSSGLGLGLWICDQLVKRHRGQLTLSSDQNSFKAVIAIPAVQ
jgi:signal transduction histidine kinase